MRTKRRVLKTSGGVLLLVCLTFVSWAQAGPPPQGPPGEAGRMQPGPRGENEIQHLVEALYIVRLQEALKLSDDQYAAVIPAVKNYLRVRQGGARSKAQAERQLNQLLESNAPDDQVQLKTKELDLIKKQNEQDLEKAQAEIDSKLDVKQRARFRQYQQHIDQRISRMIQQIREGRRMQRMQEGPGSRPGRMMPQRPPRQGPRGDSPDPEKKQ